MSKYMFQEVNSQQLNSVDSNVLSGGIKQYMEDGYSYDDAVTEILKNEGWELQEFWSNPDKSKLNYRFYNKNTKQYASVNRHNGMLVPTTTDNLCVNAFRVVYNNLYFHIEPNEWKSTFDSRRGRRLIKKSIWLEKVNRKRQNESLNNSRRHY